MKLWFYRWPPPSSPAVQLRTEMGRCNAIRELPYGITSPVSPSLCATGLQGRKAGLPIESQFHFQPSFCFSFGLLHLLCSVGSLHGQTLPTGQRSLNLFIPPPPMFLRYFSNLLLNVPMQCCSCHATQVDGVLPGRSNRQQSPAGPVNIRRIMRRSRL